MAGEDWFGFGRLAQAQDRRFNRGLQQADLDEKMRRRDTALSTAEIIRGLQGGDPVRLALAAQAAQGQNPTGASGILNAQAKQTNWQPVTLNKNREGGITGVDDQHVWFYNPNDPSADMIYGGAATRQAKKTGNGDGSGSTDYKFKEILDDLRDHEKKISDYRARIGVESGVLQPDIDRSIANMSASRDKLFNVLAERFPNQARRMGYGKQVDAYQFAQDPDMQGLTLDGWDEKKQAYRVTDGNGNFWWYDSSK